MDSTERDIWHWHHSISEAYYHIQLTVKYRRSLFDEKTESIMLQTMKEFKEQYMIETTHIGFDQNHVHILCRFLPKYSGWQVIKIIKSIMAKQIFKLAPEIKKYLWWWEFWTDGYYFATVSPRWDKWIIEQYIRNQWRENDLKQLRLFEL